MYAYIDESGNSGGNLQDPSQPFFYHMVLLSNDDLDKEKEFQELLSKHNIQEIHGSRQKQFIDSYAIDLLTILKKHDIHFLYHCTEKKIFAYIKLFEALFDNEENKSADKQIYKNEDLKFALLNYFIDTIPPNTAFDFFKSCSLEINEDKASKNFTRICQDIVLCLKKGKNNSINSYIETIIHGALLDTTNLSICSEKDYKHYNLPNLFDWMNVLLRISQYAIKRKLSIDKIIHDEQYHFKKDFDEVYFLCLLLAKSSTTLSIGNVGTMNYKALPIDPNSFEFKESSHCYGLQTVDICLYIFSHFGQYKSSKNISLLLQFVNEKCDRYETTRETICKKGDINKLIEFLS